MIAIETKYLPATNTRGSRIKAFTCNGKSASVPYNHELSTEANHYAAVRNLVDLGLISVTYTMLENMRFGGTKSGYVFCFDQSKVSDII